LRKIFDLTWFARDAAHRGDDKTGIAPHKSFPGSPLTA
jgi:hypothetical protein